MSSASNLDSGQERA